ncbi:MAG: hypothetical protein DCF25_15035 [Leptolyngbya foveolarum]|uniref:Membrane protein 6-pyruvoyl-tetrahydropterin synthase-related domain-containing protein n=1 Tax=Leptolyngbya foveolarum TaxID=47253 RepID=A0A2W4VX38_9CYAN|nr:MAG: hypothetical protein DCF25_15035 [Leptolyngbya foveolarum]
METPHLSRTNSSARTTARLNYIIESGVLALLLLAAIAINLRMIRAGFNGLGDARWHLTWIQHFSEQVLAGVWYPRWLAGTNFGYGSPTFVFYPPLIYYLGTALRAIGLTIEQAVYVLISGGIFLSGANFYLFGKSIWGRIPAVCGALAYMLNPGIYGLVHGGGFASLYAYVWMPLILLFTHRSIEAARHRGRYRLALSLVWMLVALTHLPSLLILAIAWTFYTLPLLWHQSWKVRLQTWIAAPLGWGLAAGFLIPAILEQRYINIDYMLASQAGFKAEMPSFVEIAITGFSSIFFRQWLACIAFAAIAWIGFAKQPQQRRNTSILLAVALFIIFLTCQVSWPLWQLNPILQKIELSERLDRLFYMVQAALCAVAVQSLLLSRSQARESQTGHRRRFIRVLLLAIVCAILFSNFKYSYQLSRRFPGLYSSGNGVMLNRSWIERIVRDPFSDGLIDVPEYRPRLENNAIASTYIKEEQTNEGYPALSTTVSGALPTPQPHQHRVEVSQGEAKVKIADWRSYHRQLEIDAQEPSTVILRTYRYPAWHLYVNGSAHPIEPASDGRIQFRLPTGQYEVALVYEQTLAFKLGLVVSGLSAIAFIGLGYHWMIETNRCPQR